MEREGKFDLAERTAVFGESVIRFARSIPLDPVTVPLIRQIVRAATSIGANYCEADEAGTKKEFRYRISICTRESRECKYWLRMMVAASPQAKENARTLWQESHELNRIFAAITRNTQPNSKRPR